MSSAIILLLVAVSGAFAHVCLLDPVQRGGFDISTPGANACFQPQGPCGKLPVENPSASLIAGSSYNVLFQQNLNHYNPGWQGTLDVSWGVGFNQNSDANFTIVTVVPDFWAHLQGSQTNFTVAVPVPATPCDHCVLRVRYVPNKPTEPIFHQCADVSIVAPTTQLGGRLYAVRQFDLFENPPYSALVEIDTQTGQSKHVAEIANFYFSQGLVAGDVLHQKVYFIGDDLQSLAQDIAADSLYAYDIASGKLGAPAKIYRPSGGQWNAIMATGGSTHPLLVVGQVPGTSPYNFIYQVRYLGPDGSVSAPISSTPQTDTFVNFLWASYDPALGLVYILGGDENSLVDQDATLYTVNVTAQTVTSSVLNGINFTLVSMHVVAGNPTLFALSPGETPASPISQTSWSLVSIDPATGVVSSVAEAFPWGRYAPYYGGSVYGWNEDYLFLHVFRQASGADDLAVVDQKGRPTLLTGLNRGVNGAVKLDNYIYVAPPSK